MEVATEMKDIANNRRRGYLSPNPDRFQSVCIDLAIIGVGGQWLTGYVDLLRLNSSKVVGLDAIHQHSIWSTYLATSFSEEFGA